MGSLGPRTGLNQPKATRITRNQRTHRTYKPALHDTKNRSPVSKNPVFWVLTSSLTTAQGFLLWQQPLWGVVVFIIAVTALVLYRHDW